MAKKNYLGLFAAALLINLIVASFQTSPGYMDADYYYSGGLRLASGDGFSEVTIWNYLDEPQGLPTPSHLYWMPLASIISWLGIEIFAFTSPFESAQLAFVFLASLVPLLSAKLAYGFTKKSRDALLAGVIAIFSGFYLAFVNTTETFAIYMLLGGLFCLSAGVQGKLFRWRAFFMGAIVGLMHLSRADGFIWIGVTVIVVKSRLGDQNQESTSKQAWHYRKHLMGLGKVLGGYLIVMTPWFIRNYLAIGTIMPSGGTRAVWAITYDELFSYPATLLTFDRWWAQGLKAILLVRWDALLQYMQTFVAVQNLIFLMPLMIMGAWKLRKRVEVKAAVIGWLLTLGVMTFIFPIAGPNGGFFHSGAAVQVVLWALVPVGLNQFVEWGAAKRNWNMSQAWKIFGTSLVVFSVLFSSFMFYTKLIGPDLSGDAWNTQANLYGVLEAQLGEFGAREDAIVMVLNPPGYYVVNSRAAIVTPHGLIETMFIVAEKYEADYLLLEYDHPQGLKSLYLQPQDLPGLLFLGEYQNTMIYQFVSSK